MLRPRIKTLIVAMLLMFSCSQIARADMKVYQYDGKLPFVQMMLNMMVAMGILDRLPANGAYGGYGASGYPSAWSGLSNPYVRALAMRGISPGSGNNPFSRSPWSQSPWSQAGERGISPVWGSPSWGVLPVGSYALHNNAWNPAAAYGAPAYSPHWSANDIDGWVNEPWENSAWNSDARPAARSQSAQASQNAQSQPAPLVQNFNFVAPQNGKDNNRGSKSQNYSPLAKLARPQQMPRQSNPAKSNRPTSYKKQGPSSRNTVRQKPCVTEFCGLKKPNLDGLWVAKNGEMLGIKNHRYLWSDSNSRYLTGQLKIQNEYLVANIDGHETLMRFKYKLAGNHLMTMQEDGVVREFVRTAGNQYGYPNNNRYSNNGRYYQ